jgi:IclR family KDG regulon transcriptional repressor
LDETAGGARAAVRTLQILELFAQQTDGMTLSEVAVALDLPISSVHDLLHLLVAQSYLERPAGRRYRPGPRILELGRRYSALADPYAAARRLMHKVAERCRMAVHLAALAGREIVYVDGVVTRSALGLVSQVGARLPAYATADGKALLALLPDEVLASRYASASWPRLTDRTVASFDALMRELEEVRWTGFAHDVEGVERGMHCVAVALPQSFGQALALSIAAPMAHLDADGLRRTLGVLQEIVAPRPVSPPPPGGRIGWSLATSHVDTYVEFRRAANEAMAGRGGQIVWTDANDDANKQAIDVDHLLEQQPCAVLIHPVNAATSDALFAAVRRRGVLAVCFQRPSRSKDFDFFVGGNTYQEGCMQAHALARALNGRGGVLVIEGDPYNDNARNIALGNRDTLACYPDITVLESQPSPLWSRETARAIAQEALATHGRDHLVGIIAANDDMAVGVAEVLLDQGLAGQIQLVGGDGDAAALELIRRGVMVGTAFQDPALLAAMALDDVMRVCDGSLTPSDFPRSSIFYAPAGPRVAVRTIPYTWIDRTNLALLDAYWASHVSGALTAATGSTQAGGERRTGASNPEIVVVP